MTKQYKALQHLQTKRYLLPRYAFEIFGLYRLSDAINKLRNKGHTIITQRIKIDDSIFAVYIYSEAKVDREEIEKQLPLIHSYDEIDGAVALVDKLIKA